MAKNKQSYANKYKALQMGIRVALENIGIDIEESIERMKKIRQDSQLYALEYGMMKEKERTYELIARWYDDDEN